MCQKTNLRFIYYVYSFIYSYVYKPIFYLFINYRLFLIAILSNIVSIPIQNVFSRDTEFNGHPPLGEQTSSFSHIGKNLYIK